MTNSRDVTENLLASAAALPRRPRRRRRLVAWIFVAPAITVMLAVGLFPLLYSLVVSFTDFDFARGTGWHLAGTRNYRAALGDQRFLASAVQTATILLPALGASLAIGFGLALLLDRQFRGRGLFVSLLSLPLMVAPAAAAMSFALLLTPKYGAVNDLLSLLTNRHILVDWLGSPGLARLSVAVEQTWRFVSFFMLMLLAGLQTIPPALAEASRVDGASRTQHFVFVTLPLVKWPILVSVLIALIDMVKIFDAVYIMTAGGPGGTTETLTFYTYHVGVRFFRVGYGSALSFYVIAVVLALCVLLILMTRRAEE
jgi:multiple sugar transport system permease protein